MDERLGDAGRHRLMDLRVRLGQPFDHPADRDQALAEVGVLAEAAQSVEPIGVEAGVEVDATGHAETWADAMRRQASGEEPAAFAAIRAPVLMVHGDQDPHPGAMTRDVLRACIPQLEYVSIARCGHTPWLERHARDPFLAALRDWLTATIT